MQCIPRISWDNCPTTNYQLYYIFYIVSLCLHGSTALAYGIILCINYFKREFTVTTNNFFHFLITKMRLCVIIYSLALCLHHISLLVGYGYFPKIITELLFNLYNNTLFTTLLLLINHWIEISNILKNTQNKYKKIIKWAFMSTIMFTAALTTVTDFLMIFSNYDPIIFVTIQYYMWMIACSVIGVLFAIYGNLIRKTLTPMITSNLDAGKKALLGKFKAIYLLYIIVAIPYSLIYALGIYFISDVTYIWIGVYSVFNAAGILTAVILFPLLSS